jgi:hypothetical protein
MPKKTVGRSYTSPGSEFTTLEPGDGVVCVREKPANGTWERFQGRIGMVVSINVQRFPGTPHPDYVEIGVVFTRGGTVSWFRNDELQPFTLPAHFTKET